MKTKAKRWVELADRLEEINEELDALYEEMVEIEDALYDLDNEGGDALQREVYRIMEARYMEAR